MFNFMSVKERLILLICPAVLVMIILFQGWQANHWRTEAIKEEQLKLQWQNQYSSLAAVIEDFNKKTEALTIAVQTLQDTQNNRSEELNNVLHKNQNWGDINVPDDISRLFNNRTNSR